MERSKTVNMDVYSCEECDEAFAVEKNRELNVCPICESELWEFSHEAVLVLKIKRPLTLQCEKVS